MTDGRTDILQQHSPYYTVSHKKPGITEIVISSKLVIVRH